MISAIARLPGASPIRGHATPYPADLRLSQVGKGSLATFAVGFLGRPLGGVIFGHFGDRIGRKSTLVASLVLMGAATLLIGLLPTYGSIGIAAPAMLTVLRFLQGLAIGGEWAGAATLIVEHAPEHRRGFYGSLVQIGGPVGGLLGSLTVLALSRGLSPEAFLSWGWRAPFLLAAVLVGVGLFIRLRVEESPVFRAMRERPRPRRVPAADALRRQWRSILLVACMHLAPTTLTYVAAVYLLSYGVNSAGFTPTAILLVYVTATAPLLFVNPLIGVLSDRVGRRPVVLAGNLLTIGAAYLLFPLLDTRAFVPALIGVLLIQASNYLMYMPQGAFFTELFNPEVRVSGASMGVQLATVAAGGSAPLVAQSLLSATHGRTWAIATYVAGVGAVSAVATFLARETRAADQVDTAAARAPGPA